jgi:D-alanyl-D-alanine carboxypeptidase/D-alanyl-D-alanine-endopeptidase (penicillin-binding protein 4)
MNKRFLIFIFQILLIVNSYSQNLISTSLSEFLKSNELRNSFVSLKLQDQSGRVLLSHNPEKLFVPASLQKLFTTSYVLNHLSKDFVYNTYVLSSGLVDTSSKTLNGNLIINTSGDPSLESRFFPTKSFINDLKSKLVELNIRSITGQIKIYPDFDNYQVNNQWLWSDLGNYYGSGYSLHSFKDNYVEVSFNSGNEIGSSTKIVKIDPMADSFFLENNVLVGKSNRDLSYAFGAPMQNNRTLIGTIPRNKKNYVVKISMHDPKIFLKQAVENACSELGILTSNISIKSKGNLHLDTLLVYTSPSIMDLVKCVNFKSNNNYAEHLLIKSVSQNHKDIDINQAADYLQLYWEDKLGLKEMIFKDGCGLSRLNLCSANALNELLLYELERKLSKAEESFLKSLPISGKTGTLKYFGDESVFEEEFFGKSGSMGGVRCYSGYLRKSSLYYPFTIMVNNFTSNDYVIRKRIEELVVNIYNNI